MLLTKQASLKAEAKQAQLLRELSEFYVQSRYPEAVEAGLADVSGEAATGVLAGTEEVMRWLSSLL